MKIIPEKMKEFEIQIMLHINEQLFKKGHITEYMYCYAKKKWRKELLALQL